jgi:hypothetical protein
MTGTFIPMWRIERVMRDEAAEDMPTLAEQFETRTGRQLSEM